MTSSALLAADVLLVEDDPGDVLLTRAAFEDHHPSLQLHVVGDGYAGRRVLVSRKWAHARRSALQASPASGRV